MAADSADKRRKEGEKLFADLDRAMRQGEVPPIPSLQGDPEKVDQDEVESSEMTVEELEEAKRTQVPQVEVERPQRSSLDEDEQGAVAVREQLRSMNEHLERVEELIRALPERIAEALGAS